MGEMKPIPEVPDSKEEEKREKESDEEENDQEKKDDTYDSQLPEIDEEDVPETIVEFLRPLYREPKHTVLSSPFASRIMRAISGPSKPAWFRMPTFLEFNDFKQLVQLVEDGRQFPIKSKDLLEAIQKLAPTVTMTELVLVLENLYKNALHEVDFGEFIFLLANNPITDQMLLAPNYAKYMKKYKFSPRQRVLFSCLGFYCLVQTEYDLDRFYTATTRWRFDVLSYHMAAARNAGLNELEMEKKQREARRIVRTYAKPYRSAYTAPVPFVQASVRCPHYTSYLKRKNTLSARLYPEKKKKRKGARKKVKSAAPKLGRVPRFETEEEQLARQFDRARLPRPDMRLPAEKLKEMRTRVFEDDKGFIRKLEKIAMTEYYDRLKRAAVLFSQKALKRELKKGFPSQSVKLEFFDIFRSYMPLSVDEPFILNPWVPPTIGGQNWRRPRTPPPFGRSSS